MKESDPFINWLSCNCDINWGFETEAQDLYDNYSDFCEDNDLVELKKQNFGIKLTKHNFKKCGGQGKKRRGLRLKPNVESNDKIKDECLIDTKDDNLLDDYDLPYLEDKKSFFD